MKLKDIHALFDSFVQAVRQYEHEPCSPSMHHSYTNDNIAWSKKKEYCFLIKLGEEKFHLQIRIEHNEVSNAVRLIIWGRRSEPSNKASHNTQRATFNSDKVDSALGYFIIPQVVKAKNAIRDAFKVLLPYNEKVPYWDGRRFILGQGSSKELLWRFLLVLRVIEKVKSLPIAAVSTTYSTSDEIHSRNIVDADEFLEGVLQKYSSKRRCRSEQLRLQVKSYYCSQNKDGKLRCVACDWVPPIPVKSDIIEIHHIKQVASYPKRGRNLSWPEALKELIPLCPNCHRMIESNPRGDNYSLEELKVLLKN